MAEAIQRGARDALFQFESGMSDGFERAINLIQGFSPEYSCYVTFLKISLSSKRGRRSAGQR